MYRFILESLHNISYGNTFLSYKVAKETSTNNARNEIGITSSITNILKAYFLFESLSQLILQFKTMWSNLTNFQKYQI
jgi:hypothetical protein